MNRTLTKTIKHWFILKANGHKSREKSLFYYNLITKFICNIKYFLIALISSFCTSVISADNTFAFQTHNSTEGLYVHEFSHLLYTFSVIWLVYRIKKGNLSGKRPWRLISIGMLILVIWNIWAFCGHIVEYLLPLGHLGPIPGTQTPGILVTSWLDVAYYILKFDNLISVPAMWFIYMGLADMKRDLK
ncbi:MAG: hypothetical protein ACUVQV_03885 [Dissulfurimicrobium sp.]|uniref:hypothetical protein n=1 Tax=Dissulfurimicrobium sp. TaxID=2022436 RepID=UPI0040493E75